MALSRGSQRPRPEAGFALIEVVISALIAVIVTGGVISLLNVTGRAGAELRNRSQAYSIAQEDQARLRGMQITGLVGFKETRQVTVGTTTFTINSKGSFVNDKTAELTCSEGTGSADYVQIGTEVTWTSLKSGRPPVKIESIVTPPTGSLDPTRGTLVVSVVNSREDPISAVGVSGTGPSSFAGSTDATGCAIFPNIPEGNYTVTPSLAGGFVDEQGEAPAPDLTGVVGNASQTKKFTFDLAGTINVGFSTRGYNGVSVASKADSIIWVNPRMQAQEHKVGSGGGTEKSTFPLTSLFPFETSQYTIYAGPCDENEPTGGGLSPASVLLAPGATTAATVVLPPLYVNVWTGRNSSNKGSAYSSADVWVKDDECTANRRYTTNSSGQLNNPGFPWSKYDVCADTLTGSGTGRRQWIKDVSVKSSTGTTLNFYLGSGTGTVSESGNCS